MRTKRAFVPDALGKLEDRAVPAPMFFGGTAVLTSRVYNHAVTGINRSFQIFSHNLNYGQLYVNLTQSIRSIPYHRIDGLDNQMLQIVFQLQADINAGGGFNAGFAADHAAIGALNTVVGTRTGNGTVLFF